MKTDNLTDSDEMDQTSVIPERGGVWIPNSPVALLVDGNSLSSGSLLQDFSKLRIVLYHGLGSRFSPLSPLPSDLVQRIVEDTERASCTALTHDASWNKKVRILKTTRNISL